LLRIADAFERAPAARDGGISIGAGAIKKFFQNPRIRLDSLCYTCNIYDVTDVTVKGDIDEKTAENIGGRVGSHESAVGESAFDCQ
jgi:hypothetical protein